MSRRDDRDSDTKRHRSRLDREPSPKRSRRDGKPAPERVLSGNDLNVRDRGNGDQRPRQRLQDAAPLEAPSAPDSRVHNQGLSKESDRKQEGRHNDSDKKHSGNREGTKGSDPVETPRSRSYFQHDERGNAGRFGRRAPGERGWWRDGRDQHNGRAAEREKSRHTGDDKGAWRHDKFDGNEGDLEPMKTRPAFKEKKIPLDSENAGKAGTDPEKGRHELGSERGDDRDRNPRHMDRHDRPLFRDRVPNRGERYGYGRGGGRGFRAGERFNGGREGFGGGGMRDVKKWEHDMFDEANRSPPRKNEEEQIAKVEALLSS